MLSCMLVLRLYSQSLVFLICLYGQFTVEHDQDREDANDDLDDFLEDRQDRTSEAGTSGSSDEEEDHLDNAHYIAQANARMGEPSTSGRDHPPEVPLRSMRSVNNQHLVETLELKEESLEGSQMVSSFRVHASLVKLRSVRCLVIFISKEESRGFLERYDFVQGHQI
jgi:hypothetical protein